MRIALLLIFYQCCNELERLLNSIPPNFFDVIIAIDGIYKYMKEQHPNYPDLSSDGSKDLVLSQRNIKEVYLYNLPQSLEVEKRNKYLELCENLDIDVGIIFDSDEWILFPEGVKPQTAFKIFKNNIETVINKSKNIDHNVFSMHTLDVANNYNIHKPRIWYKPGQVRYINNSHYHYANIYKEKDTIETFKKNRQNYCQHTEGVIKGIVQAHAHNLRSKHQTKIHDDYLEYLKRFEGLAQSYYFTAEQAHKLASQGVSRNEVNMQNKDEYIKKVT